MTTAPQEEVLLEDGLYWLLYALRNAPFLKEGGKLAEYGVGLNYAILQGWLSNSGIYVKFTPVGAEPFA